MNSRYRTLIVLLAALALALLAGCASSSTPDAAEPAATDAPVEAAAVEGGAEVTAPQEAASEAGSPQQPADQGAADQQAATGPAVTGTVTYRERIALPLDAVITVQLQDVSLADAPAVVVGEQVIPAEGRQVPIPFAIPYDPAQIQPGRSYSLAARIEDGGGKLQFISDTRVPVLGDGAPPENVEIVVVPTGAVGGSAVTGTVNFDAGVALPDDAVLTVQIQDVSLQDVAATIIAEQVIPLQGQQPPLSFAVDYDPATILPANTYSLAARITDASGAPLYISNAITPVLTRNNPSVNVPVTVVPVAGAVSP